MNIKIKQLIRLMSIILIFVIIMGVLSSCVGGKQDNQDEQGVQVEQDTQSDQSIQGDQGSQGEKGEEDKKPIFKVENGDIYVSDDGGNNWVGVGNNGGTDDKDGADDKDDTSFQNVEIDNQGRLVITLPDGTKLPPVVIPKFNADDKNAKILQKAKDAFVTYIINFLLNNKDGSEKAEYMLYDAEGKFVAIHNGSIVGVYDTKEKALKAMVDDPQTKTDESKTYFLIGTDFAGLHALKQGSVSTQHSFAGKTVSILSHSISTYDGVSNSTATNSTLGKNDVYYTEGRYDVYRNDTWWQQTIDALGMKLLVNNSWSGSCVFMPRKGEASVGYGDRAVNLHNDRTGEEPDIIFVYLGCNDFAYFKDTFGKADDVDYAKLIRNNKDGSYTYSTPKTACEAYAIMLHKVENRYPNAEIYCMTSTARREIDYAEDGREDAGQPTKYSKELQKIAMRFDCPVIDLENAIPKDIEIFDKYIGDKRAHPNALGMDQITNEVLSVMLGEDTEICHVICEDGTIQEQAVLFGGSYSAEVKPQKGYSVVVTMNGKNVTKEVYNNGKISIKNITGDIVIHSTIQRDSLDFHWTIKNNALVSAGDTDNSTSKLAGAITNGVLNDAIYQMETAVVLKHDLPWEIEWQCAGDWRGCMFATTPTQKTKEMYYLTRIKGGQLCFGTWTGQQHDNYGVDLSDLDDGVHTYRLVNKISADGSNMVWIYVDGAEIGPMHNYYVGSNSQNKTSNWISGKDFIFPYISMDGYALKDCRLNYLKVRECVHTYKNNTCITCGKTK